MTTPRPRLLLADDDEDLRWGVARALRQRFDVIEARDGQRAIELLEGGAPFDGVITDLEMPRIDGEGVIAWLESHRPQLARRTLVLSGGTLARDGAAWRARFGARPVLIKPCSASRLLSAVAVPLKTPSAERVPALTSP